MTDRRIKFFQKAEHPYVTLKAPLQSFYTIEQLRKITQTFAHLSDIRLWDLLKTPGLKAVTPRTFQILKYNICTYEPFLNVRTATKL